MMLEFISEDVFQMSRGTVYATRNVLECDDYGYLLGTTVKIDGVEHVVKGVERFAHGGRRYVGERMGLLV